MKLHIGVDSETGFAHSAVVIAANVHDKPACTNCCTAPNTRCTATVRTPRSRQAPQARDRIKQRVRPSSATAGPDRVINRLKSKVRSRGFAVTKRLWCFSKVRYRGLDKNATRAFVAVALANLYLTPKRLLPSVRLRPAWPAPSRHRLRQ